MLSCERNVILCEGVATNIFVKTQGKKILWSFISNSIILCKEPIHKYVRAILFELIRQQKKVEMNKLPCSEWTAWQNAFKVSYLIEIKQDEVERRVEYSKKFDRVENVSLKRFVACPPCQHKQKHQEVDRIKQTWLKPEQISTIYIGWY